MPLDLQKQPTVETSGLGVERPAAFYYSGALKPVRTDMVLGVDAAILGGAEAEAEEEAAAERFDALAGAGFNVIAAAADDDSEFRAMLQRGSAHGVFIVAAPPPGGAVMSNAQYDQAKAR